MYPRIIAVDFDGTLCENKWPEIGTPNLEMIEYLLNRKKDGARLILWTCRSGDKLEEAVLWAQTLGLEFDAVNENLPDIIESFGADTRKIFAHEYIDDKNAWPPDLMRNKQPLNRLTKVDEEGYYIDDPSVHWAEKRRGPEITRLGQYEDTGSTPEDILMSNELLVELEHNVDDLYKQVMATRGEKS